MSVGLPRYDPITCRGIQADAVLNCYYYHEDEAERVGASTTLTGAVLHLPLPAYTIATYSSLPKQRPLIKTADRTPGTTVAERNAPTVFRSVEAQKNRKSVSELIMGFERNSTLLMAPPDVDDVHVERPRAHLHGSSGGLAVPSPRPVSSYVGQQQSEERPSQRQLQTPAEFVSYASETNTRTITTNSRRQHTDDEVRPNKGTTIQKMDKPYFANARERSSWSSRAARVVYCMKQLPALLLIVVAAWIIIGYHIFVAPNDNTNNNNTTNSSASKNASHCAVPNPNLHLWGGELVTAGGALATALAVILGGLCAGIRSERLSLKKASRQCVWGIIFSILCVVLAIPTIVFATLAILQLNKSDDIQKSGLFHNLFPIECFTPNGLYWLNAMLLAGAAVLLLLSLFSFTLNIAALSELIGKRKFRRQTRASKFAYFHDIGAYEEPTDKY